MRLGVVFGAAGAYRGWTNSISIYDQAVGVMPLKESLGLGWTLRTHFGDGVRGASCRPRLVSGLA